MMRGLARFHWAFGNISLTDGKNARALELGQTVHSKVQQIRDFSVFVDAQGKALAQAPQFIETTLTASIKLHLRKAKPFILC